MVTSRRDFLALVAYGGGALALGCGKKRELPRTPVPDAGAMQHGKILGPAEWRCAAALTDRILPSGDGPGAREAGVVDFIDGQLATRSFAPVAGVVMAGLGLMDQDSHRQHGRVLADLTVDLQDELLLALSRSKIAAPPGFPQRELFRVLHQLTLEGFLSDPVHGGNADQVGWKWIGFPVPSLRMPDHSHH